ncbi:hypothetical protein [Metasolibacillus meyeri]|uniref:hypothetical protein n=1 Tax=Metasolibacillus meyeri TaxID=1071052 RepID=UPI000D301CF7|nr:hypothetical protein [Metasolibacillus meyeri]
MKKWKIYIITFLSLFLITAFFFVQGFNKEKEVANQDVHLSDEERHELEKLMWQIKDRLRKEKYGFILAHAILPNEISKSS